MASDRARAALQLRRQGRTYGAIAEELGVSKVRARALTHAALREEARLSGDPQPTQDAFDRIRLVKGMNQPVNIAVRVSGEMLAGLDGFAKARNLNRSQAIRALLEEGLSNAARRPAPDITTRD